MTRNGDGDADTRVSEEHSVVEYALKATETVVWDWNIPEDEITLYPQSQSIFEEITEVDEFISQVHPADQAAVANDFETALQETGEYRTEFRLATDATRWIAAQGIVEFDAADGPQRLTGVGQDVSERKRRYREFKRLGDYIAETEILSEIGGWELETGTDDLRWTAGTKRIHEVESDYEPVLDEAIEFYHPDDRPLVENVVNRCLDSGEPYSIEVRLITEKGRERWVHTQGEIRQRGDSEVLRGVIRDITDQKIRNQRLMVLNRVLRHNIRNSLGVVMGYAELLRDDLSALEPLEDRLADTASFSLEDAQESLGEIHKHTEALFDMSENARRVSHALQRGPPMDDVEVAPIVNALVATFSEQYPAASITVNATADGVQGNEQALEMALRELLENALVHTTAGAPRVEVSISKADADRVHIRVADDGPGIPTMEREVLKRGVEEPLLHGHGLGLWMVNWLVTKVGGSVSIEANDPTGTIVTLTLPAANSE
ncbi:PAS domain-containing protein [Haladaptatus sp. DJG-WS-42]|uniref:PAS domain-containing sensor histidine kinase n=1 Tax=Haladaptatus sp. DJG-WS-42 TaxID=3120516 RepID=UPI0030CD40F8